MVSSLRAGTQERVERTARRWVEPFARLGLAARGMVYAVVGILAIRIALERFEETDRKGALEAMARQRFGGVLLTVIAIGFGGYALWRFTQAALDTEDAGSDVKGLVERAGYFAIGLLYSVLCVASFRFVMGRGDPGGGAQEQQTWTARMLNEPYGRWLVAAAGLAVIGVGLASGYQAVARTYRRRLKSHEVGSTTRKWLDEVAVVGLVGRMAAFVLTGGFLVKAAVEVDAREAAGLDGALKRLGQHPWGDLVIVLVGVGLLAYGVFSLLESRHRRVLGR
jgi:hypothetical protein